MMIKQNTDYKSKYGYKKIKTIYKIKKIWH